MPRIDSRAIVAEGAVLADDVIVGPYCTVGPTVTIGSGSRLISHVVVTGWTEVGEACTFYPFSSVGLEPQDLKFKDEKTRLLIGNHNVIREFVTIHRGTSWGDRRTKIGDHNYLMAYTHIAHDCTVGNHVVFANAATLAGHITIMDHAVVGALSAIHQFCKVGKHAFIGGCSGVPQDIVPYARAAGNRTKIYGINHVGLRRKGFSAESLNALKRAFKLLFFSGLNTSQALERIEETLSECPEVKELVEFVRSSARGICKDVPAFRGQTRSDSEPE